MAVTATQPPVDLAGAGGHEGRRSGLGIVGAGKLGTTLADGVAWNPTAHRSLSPTAQANVQALLRAQPPRKIGLA